MRDLMGTSFRDVIRPNVARTRRNRANSLTNILRYRIFGSLCASAQSNAPPRGDGIHHSSGLTTLTRVLQARAMLCRFKIQILRSIHTQPMRF